MDSSVLMVILIQSANVTRFGSKVFFLVCFILLAFRSKLQAQEDHSDQNESEKGIIELITYGIVSYSPSEGVIFYDSETHLMYWRNHTWG